jgi:non-ribosomal peptide synthetase component F
MSITDAGRELVGATTYSRDLFERETIGRLMNHFINVLRGVAENSDRPISTLSFLGDEEREQILLEWNETRRPYPQDRCLHELFQEQAMRTPEQLAIVCEEQGVSYRELNRRANQLGNYLQWLGVGPEVVVGLCLERSLEMVVALLGVLKAGGAYLPLDPESPIDRLGYMLEETGVGVALTERKLQDRLPAFWGQVVLMDEEWERIGRESDSEPQSEVVSGNPAERSDGTASESGQLHTSHVSAVWSGGRRRRGKFAVCDGLDDHGGSGQHLYLSLSGKRRLFTHPEV